MLSSYRIFKRLILQNFQKINTLNRVHIHSKRNSKIARMKIFLILFVEFVETKQTGVPF